MIKDSAFIAACAVHQPRSCTWPRCYLSPRKYRCLPCVRYCYSPLLPQARCVPAHLQSTGCGEPPVRQQRLCVLRHVYGAWRAGGLHAGGAAMEQEGGKQAERYQGERQWQQL